MLPAIFVLAVLAVLVVAHLPAATRGQIRRCRSCIDPRSDGGPRNKCHECIVLPRGAYKKHATKPEVKLVLRRSYLPNKQLQ